MSLIPSENPPYYEISEEEIIPTIQNLQKTLTNAEIKTLPTAPIKLIKAPGANKIINIISVCYRIKKIAVYTLSDETPITSTSEIQTTWGEALANAAKTIPADAALGNTPQDILYFNAGTSTRSGQIFDLGDVETANNQPLYIGAYSELETNFIGGDNANKLTINILYTIQNI